MLKQQPTCQMNPNAFVTVMVGLSGDEAALVEWLRSVGGFASLRRLREIHGKRHQLAVVQFSEGRMGFREVGPFEG